MTIAPDRPTTPLPVDGAAGTAPTARLRAPRSLTCRISVASAALFTLIMIGVTLHFAAGLPLLAGLGVGLLLVLPVACYSHPGDLRGWRRGWYLTSVAMVALTGLGTVAAVVAGGQWVCVLVAVAAIVGGVSGSIVLRKAAQDIGAACAAALARTRR